MGRNIINLKKSNEVLTEAICPACDAGRVRRAICTARADDQTDPRA
jgi:hypothetical protein